MDQLKSDNTLVKERLYLYRTLITAPVCSWYWNYPTGLVTVSENLWKSVYTQQSTSLS